MKRKALVKRKLKNCFDFPMEIIADCPKLSLVGRGRILVENHKGIFEITQEVVRMMTKEDILTVNGSELTIKELNGECVVIEGIINGCEYENSL